MIVYKFRESDHVYVGPVEMPDAPFIPPFHTRTAPPEQDGHYAVMRNGWMLVEGETPDDPALIPPVKSPEVLQAEIVEATQKRLDDFARTRNYDGILSLCTYATSSVPKFQAEGQYGVNARDNTWATLYTILAEVEAGTRPMPTGYADIEADLPELTWPE
jgi:hypothetical protein